MFPPLKDPYGTCGSCETEVPFLDCDCVDDDGEELDPPHKPCIKLAAVIKKQIYSEEEAERRQKEEDEIDRRAMEYYQASLLWLETTAKGQKIWYNELRRSQRDAKLAVEKAEKALGKICEHIIQLWRASLMKYSIQSFFFDNSRC
jgi:hypothetical protein